MVKKLQNNLVVIWLILVCISIILMIFIGGLTRLTDSGLSITEWKPVSGILPPLTDESWEVEFGKYKESPEYIKYNFGMEISEFKSIYLLEFYHRIAGRLAFILYCIPLIFFILFGVIKIKECYIYLIGLILFVAQGIAGWYMVQSGLVSDPHVSHYRLAMHLMLAIFLYIILFWQLLKRVIKPILLPSGLKIRIVQFCCITSILLLLLQMIFGAFVAGLNAGLVYNSFPLMGEKFIPDEVSESVLSYNSFAEPVFMQFMHRIFAYGLFGVITIYCFATLTLQNHILSRVIFYTSISLIIQILSGVITILYHVPIPIALLHQFGAVLLLSFLLWSWFLLMSSK